VGRILKHRRSIVVGDRGSGKSAIFRKLAQESVTEALQITDAGTLMHHVVADKAWLDADALRVAWLAAIAAVVASVVPEDAPEQLRCDAMHLRPAFGLVTPPKGARIMRGLGRLLAARH
jgi:type II secretory pathway predicted ATPase ExeA